MQPKQGQKQDFVKKRQQFTQTIRRVNRQEMISKRRNINTSQQNPTTVDEEAAKIQYIVDFRYEDYIKKFQKSKFFLETLPQLIKALNDQDIIQQHFGVIGIRKIMSHVEDPPIQLIIDSGILVGQEEYPQLQLQSTWSLANVASGNFQQCQSVIDKGAIQLFVKLLRSKFPGVVQQAIWALGNIASDSSFNRDAIIRKGGIENLIFVIKSTNCEDLLQPGAWALSNLCRGTPLPNYQRIRQGLFLLASLIGQGRVKDTSTFADCCWSLSYSFPKKKQDFQQLISKQFIWQISSKLRQDDLGIIVPVVRLLGHITKLTNHYVDLVLEYPNIIDAFYELLYFQKKTVRMETLWVISNIASGPQYQINTLLQNESLIAKILELFQSDGDQIKREICCLFANMTIEGNSQIIYNFFKSVNIFKFYVQCLLSQDSKLIVDSLDNMTLILELGEKIKPTNSQNPFLKDLSNLGALEWIQQLQLHDEQEVYQSAVKLMKGFFQMEDNFTF